MMVRSCGRFRWYLGGFSCGVVFSFSEIVLMTKSFHVWNCWVLSVLNFFVIFPM